MNVSDLKAKVCVRLAECNYEIQGKKYG